MFNLTKKKIDGKVLSLENQFVIINSDEKSVTFHVVSVCS